MSVLDTVTSLGWVKLAAAGVVAALLTGAYVMQHNEIQSLRTSLATEMQGRAADALAVAKRDRQALADAAADRKRIDTERKAHDEDTERKLAAADRDRSVAADAERRMRARYAALVAAGHGDPVGPAVAASGAPEAAGDLSTDVLGGLLSIARPYVEAAELALVRGERCEAEYDSLKPPP